MNVEIDYTICAELLTGGGFCQLPRGHTSAHNIVVPERARDLQETPVRPAISAREEHAFDKGVAYGRECARIDMIDRTDALKEEIIAAREQIARLQSALVLMVEIYQDNRMWNPRESDKVMAALGHRAHVATGVRRRRR